jgi:hypothetical protein
MFRFCVIIPKHTEEYDSFFTFLCEEVTRLRFWNKGTEYNDQNISWKGYCYPSPPSSTYSVTKNLRLRKKRQKSKLTFPVPNYSFHKKLFCWSPLLQIIDSRGPYQIVIMYTYYSITSTENNNSYILQLNGGQKTIAISQNAFYLPFKGFGSQLCRKICYTEVGILAKFGLFKPQESH